MLQWTKTAKVLKWIWTVALLFWGGAASAQNIVPSPTATDFRSAWEHNDFTGIEQLYASLKATGERNSRGEFRIDTEVAFSKMPRCDALFPDPRDTEVLLPTLRLACWDYIETKLNGWRSAYPSSVLVAIALADFQVQKWRWQVREYGKPEDGAIEKANQFLEEIPADQRDAIWYAQSMQMASTQGMGSKRFHMLFAEAAAKYPDHALIYRQAVFHYLPRNGGSAADIRALSLEAARSGSDGELMYAYVYDDVSLGHGWMGQDVLHKVGLSWPRARAGWNEIYRRYPDQWNLNRFAQHACFAFDMPTLVRLFRLIGKEVLTTDSDAWMSGELSRCRELAARQPSDSGANLDLAAFGLNLPFVR